VGYTLRREGFDVLTATSGPEALRLARAERPDLIVLDVMLPGIDGLRVCQTLRAESTVPILLLSAKGEAVDRIVGLEIGADDYLTKPFAMRELLARIRAMLRRAAIVVAGTHASEPVATDDPAAPLTLRSGGIVIEPAARRVTVEGAPRSLKPREFDLLRFFVEHPDVVHTRESLLRRVWGYEFPIDTRTVDVHVRWLRQKIERDPAAPTRIETVRGVGYRFATASDGA
ncbi:MAG TPA: response regulator transcription factor, partial [Thermomicrobiales bacterium]|nr:response regulator transcription factor [Thermomicrobiales bacterium]